LGIRRIGQRVVLDEVGLLGIGEGRSETLREADNRRSRGTCLGRDCSSRFARRRGGSCLSGSCLGTGGRGVAGTADPRISATTKAMVDRAQIVQNLYMTTPSPAVLQTYADAWLRSDHTVLFACYADDIVAHYGGASPFAGTHRGRDAFVEVLINIAVRSQRELLAVEAVFDDGATGAIFTREAINVEGQRHEVRRALRFRLHDGLIAECWLYDQDQHLVDQAWAP
jgi:uncharacterized protein